MDRRRNAVAVMEAVEGRVMLSVVAGLAHTTASLAAPRFSLRAVTVGSKAMFAGGASIGQSDAIDIYDSRAAAWDTATLPGLGPDAFVRSAAAANDRAVFSLSSGQAEVYDASNGLWSSVPLQEIRDGPALIATERTAVLAGGYLASEKPSRAVDIYDATAGRWSAGLLSAARGDITAAAVGGKLLFAGGITGTLGSPVASDIVDILDTTSRRWSLARLSQPRYGMAVSVVGTKVLFAGGRTMSGPTAAVDICDTATGKWTTARLSEAAESFAAASVGTRAIFATGGPTGETVDIYDAITGEWSRAKLAWARQGVSAAAVGAKAVFAGGLGDLYNGNRPSADVYDASTGRWSQIAFSPSRNFVAAASVGTRAVFAGGADSTGGARSSVDIYTDTSPSPALSGYMGSGKTAAVILNNTGDAALAGPFIVNVYANHNRAVDSHAALVGQVRVEQSLAAGGSIRVKVAINPPATLAAGTYTLLAAVNKARHLTVFASQIGGLRVSAAGAPAGVTVTAASSAASAPTGRIARAANDATWLSDQISVLA